MFHAIRLTSRVDKMVLATAAFRHVVDVSPLLANMFYG